jgi:hypothetical protein
MDNVTRVLRDAGFCGEQRLDGLFYCISIPHRGSRHDWASRIILQMMGGEVLHMSLVRRGLLKGGRVG